MRQLPSVCNSFCKSLSAGGRPKKSAPARLIRSLLGSLPGTSLGALLAVLWLACLPLPARADSGSGDLWRTLRDGLVSGNVVSVFSARDGSLWFGTDRGASRYNGEWSSLPAQDQLPAGRVRAMTQTGDGAIWFAIEDGGLARRDPDGLCCTIWKTGQGLPSDDVQAVLAVPGKETALLAGTSKGLVYLESGHVTPVEDLQGLSVWALAGTDDGAVWVGTAGKGVWHGRPGGTWQPVDGNNPLSEQLYALTVDSDGTIWAGTNGGLVYFSGGTWHRFALLPDGANPIVFGMLRDKQGGLWVATNQGCFYDQDADPETAPIHLRTQDGLANDYVRAMAFGADGALWLGTIAGVSRYAGPIWQLIRDPALAGHRVNAVLTDSSGRTWVGTEGYGLAMWDGKGWRRFTVESGLGDNRVVALFEDARGRIWAGTGQGLQFWNADGTWHSFGQADGLPGIPVWSIAQGENGDLWVGTDSGLARWNEQDGFQVVPDLQDLRINAIHLSADGVLWVGTNQKGLWRYSGEKWQPVTAPAAGEANGLPAFRQVVVNGIAEQPGGKLWVGTYDAGLWGYTPGGPAAAGRWEQVDGTLASPWLLAVNWIGGSLWAGTRGGLTRFDDLSTQLYAGNILPSPEVLAIAPGLDGTYWIGSSGGLVHYRPQNTMPWLRIESINLEKPQNGAVRVSSGQPLTIRMAGGDIATRPEDLQYLTYVDGLSARVRVDSSSLVSYGDRELLPGMYRLQALVRNASFDYSDPVEVTIIAEPPEANVSLPGGLRFPALTFYPVLVLSLLTLGGLVTLGSLTWRARRHARWEAVRTAALRANALERRFNPYISGEPVREPDMFFGRHDLLHKIVNGLHQNSIMIYGERRIGKTTLLFHLAQALRAAEDREWVFIPVLIDLEGTAEKEFFYLLMENLRGVLRAYLPQMPRLRFGASPVGEYTDRDFTADLRLLLEAVKSVVAPRNVRVILLMDEMDVINGYSTIVQQQLRRIFMSSLAQNLGTVVAGIQIRKAWDRVESPWYNLFNELVVEPFPEEESRRLLFEPVRGIYEWDAKAVDFVVQRAEGRPYRLQQYGLEAVNHMLVDGRTHITLADVQAADQIIERARANQAPDRDDLQA